MKLKGIICVFTMFWSSMMFAQQIIGISGEAEFPGGDEALESWIVENVASSSDVHRIVGSHPYKAVFRVTVDANGRIVDLRPQNKITQRDKDIYNCLEKKMVNLPTFSTHAENTGTGVPYRGTKRIEMYIYGHGNKAIFRPNDKWGEMWLDVRRSKLGGCEPSVKLDKGKTIILDGDKLEKISDKAEVSFDVDETGRLVNISVKCKTNQQFAVFLYKQLCEMPKWIPATRGSKPIVQKGIKFNLYLNDVFGIRR